MYNKIAPIILNAGKNTSYSDVFIAQPDSLKENLAGKIFILAEINSKKNEGRLIFDFLVEALENYYYNDEKILLKDKIEGLKLENIFEAAVAKINKELNEFLITEKIKINVASTSITIGVIFENKLYFSGFGKNRALLIYHRNDQYEIINVETSAMDAKEHLEEKEFASPKELNIFSSVINGEIPINSYFFFTSEALPEYLSNKEIISVITKLPPIVATEQIKNMLEKINTYVPFLGVLIKNTIGLNISETKEEIEETVTISNFNKTLDHTEQKTEQILAPAGLISLTKIIKHTKNLFKNNLSLPSAHPKKSFKNEEERQSPLINLDLGRVKSLNLARADSFLVKEKIFFKKRPGDFILKLKNTFGVIIQIFNPHNWLALIIKLKTWFKTLNKKNSLLFGGLVLVILIFFGSLIFTNIKHKNEQAQTYFNDLVTQIENQENSIDAHLLYNDNDGARADLIAAQALLNSLPHEKTSQKAIYNQLANKLNEQTGKIQKLVKVTQVEKTNDLSGLTLNNIFLMSGNIYASDEKNIYSLTINSSSSTKFEINGATSLSNVSQSANDKTYLYYLDSNQIVRFDLKKKTNTFIKINNLDQSANLSTFNIYGGNLYALAKNANQIYKYKNVNGFTAKTNWLAENIDLSQASDLSVIDGNIYVLKNNGEILKLYGGKLAVGTGTDKTVFKANALLPAMTKANKIYVGVKYIYILETDSKRLAVLNKINGNLLNQYEIASLNNLKDFTVNEEGKLAYFLANGGIYRINLNQ
ncbi:MAG: hypothetical protein ACYC40_00160 [Patescibacteria group bacterium]